MNFSIVCAKRKVSYMSPLIFCILLILPQTSLAMKNVFRKAYEDQKELIDTAQVGMKNAIDQANNRVVSTDKAQQAAGTAAEQLAKVRTTETETPAQKNKVLDDGLKEAQEALIAAQESLKDAKDELENTKIQLEASQADLETMRLNNEDVGDQASVFSYVRNGFFASLLANFAVIAPFLQNRRKRRLELKVGEVDLAIKKAQLKRMQEKNPR